MAVRLRRSQVFPVLLSIGTWGCNASMADVGNSDDHLEAIRHYSGTGFVVHEWGTDTVVVGSDGSLQRGLHHEEEGLPGFVYNRISAAENEKKLNGNIISPTESVIKMETPVTYFYSDTPRAVTVAVNFPQGVFTQWYPASRRFSPPLTTLNDNTIVDPLFNLDFPFRIPLCVEKYGTVHNGLLDWGTVQVLDREDAQVNLPEAPLDKYAWSYAREVASNPIRIAQAPEAFQDEKFLFYRGLGNFELPVRVKAPADEKLTLENAYRESIGPVFVIHVGKDKGAFVAHHYRIASETTLDATIPSLEGASDLDAYTSALADAVTSALDETGLYHDEAIAMINTWKRQWFGTPGVRVLYLMPQSWTDESIPLTINPAPKSMLRVMMIRVEVITPDTERTDAYQVTQLGNSMNAPAAAAYFRGLGRFAEPRLRRALSLMRNPKYGNAFLDEIATVETHVGLGE